MYFHPDPVDVRRAALDERPSGATARLICDVANADGSPFEGDPRVA